MVEDKVEDVEVIDEDDEGRMKLSGDSAEPSQKEVAPQVQLGTLLKQARLNGETFEDYKMRRRSVKQAIDRHAKYGTPFYSFEKDERKVPYKKPKE